MTTYIHTDSKDLLSTFLGTANIGRDNLVIEATSRTALRSGDWVMIPAYKGVNFRKKVGIEVGSFPVFQLYNLKDDIGQKNNLAESNPKKLAEMIEQFEAIRGKEYSLNVKDIKFR